MLGFEFGTEIEDVILAKERVLAMAEMSKIPDTNNPCVEFRIF